MQLWIPWLGGPGGLPPGQGIENITPHHLVRLGLVGLGQVYGLTWQCRGFQGAEQYKEKRIQSFGTELYQREYLIAPNLQRREMQKKSTKQFVRARKLGAFHVPVFDVQLFDVRSLYIGAILPRVFYVQVFHVQSSTFSLSTQSRSTFCRTILFQVVVVQQFDADHS